LHSCQYATLSAFRAVSLNLNLCDVKLIPAKSGVAVESQLREATCGKPITKF
jgi:hypothetical protein